MDIIEYGDFLRKKTIEEYLEIIYILEESDGHASTGKIANLMEIKAPSVSEMLSKLEKEELVTYEPYKGAKLTSGGLKIAKEINKKHKAISKFLKMIGVDQKTSEIDACRLEHHISNESMEKLLKFLSFIKEAPVEPMWLKRFYDYLETGERPECQTCLDKEN